MQTTPPIQTDRLPWLLELFGPEGLARITRELTAEENALVEAGIARHGGDPVAAFGASPDNPVADDVRALFEATR